MAPVCGTERLVVKLTSAPPGVFKGVTVKEVGPVKQRPEVPVCVHPVGHTCAAVQLFLLPATPDLQLYSTPGLHVSETNAPPQNVPDSGTPRMFVTVQFCMGVCAISASPVNDIDRVIRRRIIDSAQADSCLGR